jgi:hypothetical protein
VGEKRILWESQKEGDHRKDAEGRIILQWILKK